MAIESVSACMHAMLCSYVSARAQIITTISLIWQTCGDDDDDDDGDDDDGDDLHAHDDYHDPDTHRIRASPVGSRRIPKKPSAGWHRSQQKSQK